MQKNQEALISIRAVPGDARAPYYAFVRDASGVFIAGSFGLANLDTARHWGLARARRVGSHSPRIRVS